MITARNTDVGALINAGNGGPAQELFHIAAIAKLRVFVNVPRGVFALGAFRGFAAELTLSEFPGRQFRGTLVRTAEAIGCRHANIADRSGCRQSPPANSSPGAYAEVHLTLPAAVPSLLLPVGAILFRSEGLRVGVVRDGDKVELVPVTLGKDYGTEVEVVSGLSANDSVILSPPDSLTAGTRVRVVETGQTP